MKTHGKRSTYNAGCRCDLCVAAAQESNRAKVVRRAARLTGAEVPPEFAARKSVGAPTIKPGDERDRVVSSHLGYPVLHHIPVAAIGVVPGDILRVVYTPDTITIRKAAPGIELTPLAPGTTLEPRFTGALRKDLAK